MSQTLPLFSKAQLQSHNKKNDVWVSLYNRKIYNVTDFIDEHPGGGDLILEHAGQDVTNILSDEASHTHSETTYEILDENYLVGYLANEEEEKELLSNSKHQVDVRLEETDNLHSDNYDSTKLDGLPTYDKLSLATDFRHDYKNHKFLDLNKPLLLQVLFGNFSKEFYLDQVHRPRHYGKGSALLFGNFLEPLSLTPWFVVPLVWLPVDAYVFYLGYTNQSKLLALLLFGIGLFVWTLIEYAMHRFLFHLDYYLPDNHIAFTVHFLLHGVHHYLPMDRYRLVMPPTLFIALAYPFYKLVFSILPYYMACSGFAGGFLGYIMYDCTHYILHHAKLPAYLQQLKKYHLEHHYKNYELGFGVTSWFWDKAFGTYLEVGNNAQKLS